MGGSCCYSKKNNLYGTVIDANQIGSEDGQNSHRNYQKDPPGILERPSNSKEVQGYVEYLLSEKFRNSLKGRNDPESIVRRLGIAKDMNQIGCINSLTERALQEISIQKQLTIFKKALLTKVETELKKVEKVINDRYQGNDSLRPIFEKVAGPMTELIHFSMFLREQSYESKWWEEKNDAAYLINIVERILVPFGFNEKFMADDDIKREISAKYQGEAPLTSSLFIRVGGERALSAVLDTFYKKMLSDPKISGFFAKADMNRVKKNHLSYLVFVCGGPDNYRQGDMNSIHKHLGIQDAHYDLSKQKLQEALTENGVSKPLIEEILNNFEKARALVLGSQSLYDRLGGQSAIDSVIDIFYRKMFDIPNLAAYFRGKNVDAIKRRQKIFQASILGGNKKYDGRDMYTAHKGLDIKDEDFTQSKKCLEGALTEAGVERALVVEVLIFFESYRKDCVVSSLGTNKISLEESSSKDSLFSRVGGEGAINLAVDLFYTKMMDDYRVNYYFNGVNMKVQAQQQKNFLTGAMGGPKNYKGKDMYLAHVDLHVTDTAFDITKEHLVNTLKELKVSANVVQEIGSVFESLRSVIMPIPLIDRVGGESKLKQIASSFSEALRADSDIMKTKIKTFSQADLNRKIMEMLLSVCQKNIASFISLFEVTREQNLRARKMLDTVLLQAKVHSHDITEFMTIFDGRYLLGKSAQSKSLLERVGGEKAVELAVELFYKKMLADPRVNFYFNGVNMKIQNQQQTAFLTQAMGGKAGTYKGRDMKKAHVHLNVTDTAFDVTKEHLVNTLRELKVEEAAVLEIGDVFESLRKEIIPVPLLERLGGYEKLRSLSAFFQQKLQSSPLLASSKIKDVKPSELSKSIADMLLRTCNRDKRNFRVELGITTEQTAVARKLFEAIMLENKINSHDIGELTVIFDDNTTISSFKNMGSSKQNLNMSVFERLGGAPAIEKAVEMFYNKVLADRDLKGFFQHTNMDRQRKMQTSYLTFLFGGPNNYVGKNMYAAHSYMKITDKLFDDLKMHLEHTLRDLKVEEELLKDTLFLFEAERASVVFHQGPLFERIGGEPVIEMAVKLFYERVITDWRINSFFKNINIVLLREKQKHFLIQSFGGPKIYGGKDMLSAHSYLNVKQQEFEIMREHLLRAFADVGVTTELIEEVRAVYDSYRHLVINNCIDTLYYQLGGEGAIKAAVELFYKKMLAHEKMKPFFEKTDMKIQKQKQIHYMSKIFSGPDNYNGLDMYTAHKAYKITDEEFNISKELFAETLKELKVNRQGEAVRIFEKARREVVDSKGASLYERIGGEAAMTAAVNLFYKKMLADSFMGPFFEHTDMNRQKERQIQYLTFLFGGPNNYKGRDQYTAHKGLGLTDEHFDRMKKHLVDTLIELGVAETFISDIRDIIESEREKVLGKVNFFERVGGADGVANFVELFYKKVLKDDQIGIYFKSVNMEILKKNQRAFLSRALGDVSSEYKGREMHAAHSSFKIKNEDFNVTKRIFEEALKELKIHDRITKHMLKLFESQRNMIVSQYSLYDRVGGETGLKATVDIFYKKMLADSRIAPFFTKIDMDRQRNMQVSFLTLATQGPNFYSGRDMYTAHKHLALTNEHFNITKGYLEEAMSELLIPKPFIEEVSERFESQRKVVVSQELTLFDHIGGENAVNAAVDLFYVKMLNDPKVSFFFKNTDMDKQRRMQKMFLSMAFGKKGAAYSGQDMKKAHMGMKIKHEEFDITKNHLKSTLEELKVDPKSISSALKIFESQRDQVVEEKRVGSLYDNLGGDKAIRAAVELFYNKMLADDRVNYFFFSTNMDTQREQQRKFLTAAFGGPNNYTGRDMKSAHKNYKISKLEFDVTRNHLASALEDLNVASDLVSRVCEIFDSLHGQVVNDGGQDRSELFKKLGGSASIDAAVDLFYKKMLADPSISFYFQKTDMKRQAAMQKKFLTQIFGGPKEYAGKNMRDAHKGMKISQADFSKSKIHLQASLRELGVDQKLVLECCEIFESYRGDVCEN